MWFRRAFRALDWAATQIANGYIAKGELPLQLGSQYSHWDEFD